MGVLRTADDFMRTLASGITFGLADRLPGAGGAEATAAARDRLGVAGDIATGLGYVLGPSGAVRGAIGLGRAALPALRVAARNPGAAAVAGGTALGTGIAHADRTRNAQPQRQAPARNTASAGGGIMSAAINQQRNLVEQMPKMQARAREAAVEAARPQPGSFEHLVQSVAQEQGGISIGQMAALAQIHNQTRAPAQRPLSARDQAGQVALANIAQDRARLEEARQQGVDPARLSAMEEVAAEREMEMLRLVLGQDIDALSLVSQQPEG